MTDELLSRVWEIPRRGVCVFSVDDREVAFRCILEREDVRGISVVTANQLSLEMRLLHHITARILLPKTGRFDFITERELMVMTSLIERRQINLPSLMLTQMHDAAIQCRHYLPYGMALTRLFRACGVSLEGEIPKEILHTDVYDERSLHHMGYRLVAG